jgi:lipoprotein-releasing system permease protein
MVSHISLTGIICGTAALIIVLSVFNGFENLTRSIYSAFDAELKITPKSGKTFFVDSAKIEQLLSTGDVENLTLILDENVLLQYGDRQTIALMRGVSANYTAGTPLGQYMYVGEFKTSIKNYPSLVAGYGVAAKIGIYNINNDRPILVHVPKREGKISLNNPSTALNSMDVLAAGIFAIEKNLDETYVFASIEFVQELLDRKSQISAMEIKLIAGVDPDVAAKKLSPIAGSEMQIKTRFQQNETLYRMMRSEKLIVYAILILIVIILSFNISGSLSMLMTEKRDDIATMQSMGATDKLIRRIFISVGIFVTIRGIIVGMLLGLILCILQQYFGFLKLPGTNMLVNAYPVQVIISDIPLVLVSVFIIGYSASCISVFKTRLGA